MGGLGQCACGAALSELPSEATRGGSGCGFSGVRFDRPAVETEGSHSVGAEVGSVPASHATTPLAAIADGERAPSLAALVLHGRRDFEIRIGGRVMS